MNGLTKAFGRHSDIAMIALVVGVLLVLFAPIPSALLDLLILSNFSFAFLLLLLTFYMARPVEFSTFPSLLLIATLFRLSLNVAATRLILSDANAGRVIGAIGSFVVGGNYVIGLIVFLILIVVQYVVVTSGAQRVSEVAARFTLDSMPGQQMSIDADLNMGFIDQAQAQARRKNIEKEAAFYGAMDGASKFVKGDAIAGIVILLINVVGGLIIGVMQHNLAWGEALQTYTLLTIGDGIVTQVPALVIAVGTGIIVTRSASDASLSTEALRQITSIPKALLIVAGTLAGLLFLPGIPALQTVLLAVIVLTAGLVAARHRAAPQETEGAPASSTDVDETAGADGYEALNIDPIEVNVGAHWAALIHQPASPVMERVAQFRKAHALELGLVLPRVLFKEVKTLMPGGYEIVLDGTLCARGDVSPEAVLAIHPTGDVRSIPGEVTRDPTYGLPALWIDASQREAASLAKFTLVDGPSVFVTHLTEVLRRESARLLSRSETEKLLGRVRKAQAGLVEEVIPTTLSVSDLQHVLQNLLKEKVSIRNIEAILETLADAGRHNKDPLVLTEAVRLRLGHAICHGLAGDKAVLHVLTLDPSVEADLLTRLQAPRNGERAATLDPRVTEKVVLRIAQQAEKMMKGNLLPVLLCAPELRRHVRTMSERVMPHLRVLSMAEIPQNIELKSWSTVSL